VIRRLQQPTPERLAALRADADRQLSREELDAYVNAPMGDAEREEIRSLVSWFTRRYPTAQERLAYARRAYARWAKARPPV
jgi:hypothetical protein